MGNYNRMDIVIKAAKIILDSLSNRDRIAFINFNSIASVIGKYSSL